MLKYSLYTIKNNTAEKSLIFRGRAHTHKDSRQRTLNLSSSEPHPHVSAINFAC